jgi:uncharacterized oxidoreductase
MNITNKTVLITGGGSGIGYETAKLLTEKGNKVIIIGRTADKLHKAASTMKNAVAIPCDINSDDDVSRLVDKINADHPELSVLINNAGKAFVYTHSETAGAAEKARQEMETNYFSLIRLTEGLLPLLKKQPEAAIVNVTSIVALAPVAVIPTYSDSKAAVHSYTLSLRHALAQDTNIKVFELLPPTVNTEFSREIGGETHGMPATEVAQGLLEGLENNNYEIAVGKTIAFRDHFYPAEASAFDTINAR